MRGWREGIATAARLDEWTAESLLHIFFAPTETSRAKGEEFLGRFMERSQGRDTPPTLAARDAQCDAIVEWGIPDHRGHQCVPRMTPARRSREMSSSTAWADPLVTQNA